MAIITGTTVNWTVSPRIIIIPDTVTDITVVDLQDTLLDLEDSEEGIVWPYLRNLSGGEDLGGGVSVGYTMELQNAQIQFEGRTAATETGAVSTSDSTGTLLNAAGGAFVTNGVSRGDTVFNNTTGAIATILSVTDNQNLVSQQLSGGSRATWLNTDTYSIYVNEQCTISGGNVVAVDSGGSPISPILQSVNTNVIRTSSSSATTANQESLEFASFAGGVAIDPINGTAGTAFPQGTREYPVSGPTDAETISHERGLHKYFILSSLSIGAGEGFGGESHVVIGDSPTNVTLTVAAAADVSNCDFQNINLVGAFDTGFIARECLIGNVTGINGHAYNCSLQGPIQLAADISIQGCWTAPDDGFEVVDIDFNSQAVDCDISGFQGGRIRIKNMVTGSSMYFTGQGEIEIDISCTGGTLRIYGDVHLIETGTLDTLDDHRTARTVWENQVEGTYTAEQVMRIMSAALAGKASGLDSSAPVFRDINDTKNRITATTDANGNRTAVTLVGS